MSLRDASLQEALRNDRTGKVSKLLKKREALEKQSVQTRQGLDPDDGPPAKRTRVLASSFGTVSAAEELEERFRNQTIGLQSQAEFAQKRKEIDELLEKEVASRSGSKDDSGLPGSGTSKMKSAKKLANLSFADSEDSEDGPAAGSKQKTKKNPFADTSCLQDAAREQQKQERRVQLVEEYEKEQDCIKEELISVTYSYWDGSGHRRQLQIQKKATIGQFLKAARAELVLDFLDLRHCASDDLLFVKEDLIVGHNVTFYELVRDQARGKSGNPLFQFEVKEAPALALGDVRQIGKGNSGHAAKIVQRTWYDKQKHCFPQKNWVKYEPGKQYFKRDPLGPQGNV